MTPLANWPLGIGTARSRSLRPGRMLQMSPRLGQLYTRPCKIPHMHPAGCLYVLRFQVYTPPCKIRYIYDKIQYMCVLYSVYFTSRKRSLTYELEQRALVEEYKQSRHEHLPCHVNCVKIMVLRFIVGHQKVVTLSGRPAATRATSRLVRL